MIKLQLWRERIRDKPEDIKDLAQSFSTCAIAERVYLQNKIDQEIYRISFAGIYLSPKSLDLGMAFYAAIVEKRYADALEIIEKIEVLPDEEFYTMGVATNVT